MISLENNSMVVRFPNVHPDAVCTIEFQRTLRIPDDNRAHALPPGLGKFPLFHTDDYAGRLPPAWSRRGGVFFPMRSAEAMWIRFHSKYPFAIKIATGKINAVTGERWTPELRGPRTVGPAHDLLARGPVSPRIDGWTSPLTPKGGWPTENATPKSWGSELGQAVLQGTRIEQDQDYVTVPRQPWLDGFSVGKGTIRQFVAMPMGDGYSVEEQLTGEALHGGLQIMVYPLKAAFYHPVHSILRGMSGSMGYTSAASASAQGICSAAGASVNLCADMGLAPGGLMKQTIHEDEYGIDHWDQTQSARCFVHLLNTQQFRQVTGLEPPQEAPTAAQYASHGLPWFDYYDESAALKGSKVLQQLDSVAALSFKKGEQVLPENDPVAAPNTVKLQPRKSNRVREGTF